MDKHGFRFVEVVNSDERENYSKLVLKKVFTFSVDQYNNHEKSLVSNPEIISNQYDRVSSVLKPSLFTPKPFFSSTTNLDSNRILDNESSPKPIVPPKPSHLRPYPPPPVIKPRCALPNDSEEVGGISNSDSFVSTTSSEVSLPKIQPVLTQSNNQQVKKSQEFQELIQQKSQVRERLFSKIEVLREEEKELSNEKVEVDFLLRRLYLKLLDKNELDADRFSMFIQEAQQITKLKVGLSLRLSRLENDGHVKYSTDEFKQKRVRLLNQISEAKSLQKNTDRRRFALEKVVQNHLSGKKNEEFAFLLDNLVRVVKEQREMEHKILLGEEKLRALDDMN